MEGRELRRSVTLSQQLSAVGSSNLRDLLKVRDDDVAQPFRRDSVTLASVMASEKLESAAAAVGVGGSGRTLLDIMQREQEMSRSVVVDGSSGNGINWKSFKDRILLRRSANAWLDAAAVVPSHPDPFSDPEVVVPAPPNPTTSPSSVLRSVPTRNTEPPQEVPTSASDGRATATEQNAAASAAASSPRDPSASRREVAVGSNNTARSHLEGTTLARAPVAVAEEQQSPRISLMALLEQTDGHWGGSPAGSAVPEVEDEANEDSAECNGIRMFYVCCVCLVRHKGAAFIPCGHTFCRLCSRELWMNRGSCPLCNRHILETVENTYVAELETSS